MKTIIHPLVLVLSLALAGCSGSDSSAATTASTAQTSHAVPEAAAPTTSSTVVLPNPYNKDDLHAFAVGGNRILNSQIGDLDGDGRPDALIVLDPPSTSDTAGQGPSRPVLLVTRNADGHLQVVARNDKVVPCERCGGLAGDPFGYARIDKKRFTLVTEGGSRGHWWNEYTFKYVATQRSWMLEKVRRGAGDTVTGRSREIALTAKDFGMVRFEDFDPSTLAKVSLP